MSEGIFGRWPSPGSWWPSGPSNSLFVLCPGWLVKWIDKVCTLLVSHDVFPNQMGSHLDREIPQIHWAAKVSLLSCTTVRNLVGCFVEGHIYILSYYMILNTIYIYIGGVIWLPLLGAYYSPMGIPIRSKKIRWMLLSNVSVPLAICVLRASWCGPWRWGPRRCLGGQLHMRYVSFSWIIWANMFRNMMDCVDLCLHGISIWYDGHVDYWC